MIPAPKFKTMLEAFAGKVVYTPVILTSNVEPRSAEGGHTADNEGGGNSAISAGSAVTTAGPPGERVSTTSTSAIAGDVPGAGIAGCPPSAAGSASCAGTANRIVRRPPIV